MMRISLVHLVAPRLPITATGREADATASATVARRAASLSASREFDPRSPHAVTTSTASSFDPTVMRYTTSPKWSVVKDSTVQGLVPRITIPA